MNRAFVKSGFRGAVFVILFLAAALIFLLSNELADETTAYVDPTLAAVDGGMVSVIVSGETAERAAQALEQVGGTVSSNLWVINAAGGRLPVRAIDQLAALPGVEAIVQNHTVSASVDHARQKDPDQPPDDHSKDLTQLWNSFFKTDSTRSYTSDPMIYDFPSPIVIDVGADLVHKGTGGEGGVTGKNVTIAVVDSGMYFSWMMPESLEYELDQHFKNQYDFVGDNTCQGYGLQGEGYCFSGMLYSQDPYGHGTHVGGIIWNEMIDQSTGVVAGVAPGADIISIRVLGADGRGTYEDVIEGIQFAIEHKDEHNIRVMNLSLSGTSAAPYFVDPLNRAVEAAWNAGIVVVAAAGNTGPHAESISVPGNDPYIITVGAVDTNRTAGNWDDDTVPSWSAAGPTLDGFVKPDVLAPGSNVISFMHNDPYDIANSATLVQLHPDYAETTHFFRMNGTSMSTAVTSGVVALMLEANPDLTPDEVKFRLMYTAAPAVSGADELALSPLQQGAGRIWAPAAVFDRDLPKEKANSGMDVAADLAHPWIPGDSTDPAINPDLAYHYCGPIQRSISDDGSTYLYFVENNLNGARVALGAADAATGQWLDFKALVDKALVFDQLPLMWSAEPVETAGTYAWSGGTYAWSGGTYAWSGGTYAWSGGTYAWSGGTYAWSGGTYAWSGGTYAWSGGHTWIDDIEGDFTGVSSQPWVE